MASRALLDLLNLSSAPSTPSARAPTSTDRDQTQLQQDRQAQLSSTASSPTAHRSPVSSNVAADSLLALLTGGGGGGGGGGGFPRGQAPQAYSPYDPSSPLPRPVAQSGNESAPASNVVSPQLSMQAENTTSPQAGQSYAAAQQPNTPSMFDFVSPFDLLERSRKASAPPTASGSAPRKGAASSTVPAASDSRLQASTSSAANQQPSRTVNGPSEQPKPSVPEEKESAPAPLAIDPSKHASRHLSGLHASSGFDDAISSGYLSTSNDNGIQTHTLQLSAPQPGGPNTLHPAKLDIVPISLIETPFAPQSALLHRGLWPRAQVAALGGRIVAYIMKKGKIRLLDEYSGERALLKTDSAIKSIFSAPDDKSGKTWTLAALTEAGVSIWSVDRSFGRGGGVEPRLVARISNEPDAPTITYAAFRPASEGRELLLVSNDGSVAIAETSSGKRRVVAPPTPSTSAACFSPDGTVVAVLETEDQSAFSVHMHRADALEAEGEHLHLSLEGRQISNISHLSLLSGSESICAAVIGINNSTTLAVFDLAAGQCRHLFDFQHKDDQHFNLVSSLMQQDSTLFVSSSLRASFFSIGLNIGNEGSIQQGSNSKQGTRSIIKSAPFAATTPSIKECALPEPYTSLDIDADAVDSTIGGGIRTVALHPGGIHVVRVPQEALAKKPLPSQKPDEVLKSEDTERASHLATHGNMVTVEPVTPIAPDQSTAPTDLVEPIEAAGPVIEVKPTLQQVKDPESEREPAKADQPEEEKPWEQEVMANADAMGTPTGTALSLSVDGTAKEIKRASESDKKKKDRRSKAPSARTGDNSRAATPSLFDRSTDQAPSSSSISNENVSKLIALVEAQQLSASSPKQRQQQRAQATNIGPDAARLIAQSIAPHIDNVARDLLQQEVHRGIEKAVAESIATELHALILRPDVTHSLTRSISQSIVPTVQETAMNVVTKVLAPHFEDVMGKMVERIERRVDGAMTSIRKEIVAEQSTALLQSEASLRDMARQMSELSAQMEGLGRANAKLGRDLNTIKEEQKVLTLNAVHSSQVTQSLQTPRKETSALTDGSADHQPPQAAPTSNHAEEQIIRQPTAPKEAPTFTHPSAPISVSPQELEDSIVAALSTGNLDVDLSTLVSTLTQLESRYGGAHGLMWNVSPGKPTLSQPVLLALVHRLANSLKAGFAVRNNITAEQAVPWIETCLSVLDKHDPSIEKYIQHAAPPITQALIEAQGRLASQGTSSWWTHERLVQGSLRYLQL